MSAQEQHSSCLSVVVDSQKCPAPLGYDSLICPFWLQELLHASLSAVPGHLLVG